jgi:SAM-dependent methyltransferase
VETEGGSTAASPWPGRGCLDEFRLERGRLRVIGWMLHPEQEVDCFRLRLDGRECAAAAPVERPDVAAAFPAVQSAARSGIDVEVELQPGIAPAPGEWFELCVEGMAGERIAARARLELRTDYADLCPSPPAHLMRRVALGAAPIAFRLDGLRTMAELLEALAAHRPLGTVRRLLDWGCGCGRVAAFLPARLPELELSGCDVDGEAVAWCRAHLRGTFDAVPFDGPLPYPDGSFDAVLGFSVLTHLTARHQRRWIAECARVLASGGLFLATTQGQRAARILGLAELGRRELIDDLADAALDGVLARGVYRAVFQTEAATRRLVGDALEVVEHRPGAILGFQDLYVMRRRGAP